MPKSGDEFSRFIKDLPPRTPRHRCSRGVGHWKGSDVSLLRAPINASQAWQRELHGSRAWSLCGVNHTLSSARAMDGFTGLAYRSGPALGCGDLHLEPCPATSSSSFSERQAEYLWQRQLGRDKLRDATTAGDSSRGRLRFSSGIMR